MCMCVFVCACEREADIQTDREREIERERAILVRNQRDLALLRKTVRQAKSSLNHLMPSV